MIYLQFLYRSSKNYPSRPCRYSTIMRRLTSLAVSLTWYPYITQLGVVEQSKKFRICPQANTICDLLAHFSNATEILNALFFVNPRKHGDFFPNHNTRGGALFKVLSNDSHLHTFHILKKKLPYTQQHIREKYVQLHTGFWRSQKPKGIKNITIKLSRKFQLGVFTDFFYR